MNIHEYQAKELLAGFGVAIPRGGVAYSPEQAVYRASEIGAARYYGSVLAEPDGTFAGIADPRGGGAALSVRDVRQVVR